MEKVLHITNAVVGYRIFFNLEVLCILPRNHKVIEDGAD